MKVMQENKDHKTLGSLSVIIEVMDIQNESMIASKYLA